MSIPYVVKVTKTKQDIHVEVSPQPIVTKEAYLKIVSARVEGILMKWGQKGNSILNRSKLRKELVEALTDFHRQNMIKPKEG